jgi:catechol 2,3-dioxygenase
MTTDRYRDIAHLGHAELLTPVPGASLAFFTDLSGRTVVAASGAPWFPRGHVDHEAYSPKLAASDRAGPGHVALRAQRPAALSRRTRWLKEAGTGISGTPGDAS